MIEPEMISRVFERNLYVIKRQVAGMTHEDCLLQLPFRGNCFNWVLGHILVSRESALKYLDQEPLMSENQIERYSRDSDPILEDGPGVINLSELLEILEKSQELMENCLEELSEKDMRRLLGTKNPTPLGDRLEFLGWHEGYHVGQMEYLRQLAGKDDKVI